MGTRPRSLRSRLGDATSFTIPKERVPARIVLEDGAVVEADLFISVAVEGIRIERPSDVLGGEPFLPVKSSDGTFRILRSASIACLTVRAEFESGAELAAEDLAAGSTHSAKLVIGLRGGTKIEGTVVYLAPEGQRRVQDFLNQNDPCVRVRDEDLVHIVVKIHVLDVRPL